MKRLLLVMVTLGAFECSAQTSSATVEDLGNYISQNAPLADSGKLLWSDFYKQIFSKLAALNASGEMLERENRLIRNAELYEAGKIDKSEFDYRRRMVQAEAASADQAARNAEQAQRAIEQRGTEAREQQRSNAILATAAQLLQASAPRTLAPAPSPVPNGGMTGFLQSQSVNGFLRYCRYSNGVVNTINSINLCPLSIQ
jgi:hypothetical protein